MPAIVAKKLGYKGDPTLLASELTVTTNADIGTISVKATGPDPSEVAKRANTFATVFLSYLQTRQTQQKQGRIAVLEKTLKQTSKDIAAVQGQLSAAPKDVVLKAQSQALSTRYQRAFSDLQAQFEEVSTGPGLTVLQKATAIPSADAGTVLTAPTSRSGRLKIAGLAGLLLGIVLALLLDRFDTRLRRRNEVQEAMNLPVLAEVPKAPRSDRKTMLFMVHDPGGAQAEAFRGLRSSMMLIPGSPLSPGDSGRRAAAQPPAVILVVSARAGEGKTTTAANLAAAMAESGKRVLVLDCDFRNPTQHQVLDVPWGPGLSDLWDAEASELFTLSRPTAMPNLRLVTAGNALDRPVALPTKMAGLIQEARGFADVVIIDAAPLLTANEAIDLMPYVDSVLVVCRSGRTTRDQAHRSVELLGRMRVPVSGIVLNGTPRTTHGWQRFTTRNGSEERAEALSGKATGGD